MKVGLFYLGKKTFAIIINKKTKYSGMLYHEIVIQNEKIISTYTDNDYKPDGTVFKFAKTESKKNQIIKFQDEPIEQQKKKILLQVGKFLSKYST